MRCFCFKTKDKTEDEPNARPVTTGSGTGVAEVARKPGIEPALVIEEPAGIPDETQLRQDVEVPDRAQTPWEKALSRLTPADLGAIEFASPSAQPHLAILDLFMQETTVARDACSARQWRYENGAGEEILVRDRFNKLLATLTKYSAVGDFIVQPLPSVVGLAWGGFKLLLHAATADMDNTALAMESLEVLGRVLGRCAVYERLYCAPDLQTAVAMDEALVTLYVLVLRYLCYLKKHLGRNTAARGFRNIAAGVTEVWTELLAAEVAVDKEAGIAHQEATSMDLHAHTRGITGIMALLQDTNALREPILRIASTVEDIFQSIQDDERLSILTWLSGMSTKQHHEFSKSLRTPGTGGWLQDKDVFRQWRAADSSSLLWLHGIAGSGKTTLASKIIDEIEHEARTTGDSLAYFYCNYKEELRRDPGSILRSLIKQLCLRSPNGDFPAPVLDLYMQRRQDADLSNLLNTTECKTLLIKLSAGFRHTTIVLDALDECEPTTREHLFDVLDSVVAEATANPVKVFVTSRDDADLRKRFVGRPEVYIQDRDNSADIACYIRAEIVECIRRKKLLDGDVSPELQDRIVRALEAGANGMFIWVKYQIKQICSELTAAHVERALTELPKDLDELYATIMHALRTQHGSARRRAVAEEALKWILFSARPMKPAELLAALPDAASLAVVFHICQNLVVLDERLDVLRFAHFSLQEFLLRQFDEADGHAGVAEACLQNLMKSGGEDPRMYEYAAANWPAHVRLSGAAPSTIAMCLRFLAPSEAYATWVEKISIPHYFLLPPSGELLSPLLVAAHFQLERVFETLLQTTDALNAGNENEETSLHLVAMNGNVDIARILLTRMDSVDVERRNKIFERTALSIAAEGGHHEVARLLLDLPAVDVNSTDNIGQTPLFWASWSGHSAVVQVLFTHPAIDVNLGDRDGQTPLFSAAQRGHEDVVRLFLANPATVVDATDPHGWSAVFLAARAGNDGILRLLLERDAEADRKDQSGRTPLSFAVQWECLEVVRTLMERDDVDINSQDSHDERTLLMWAALCGNTGVVQILLAQTSKAPVNVNSKDKSGQSALHWAAQLGYSAIAELLLGVEGVDVDSPDNFDRTPLSMAANYGAEEVVRMLVANAGVQVDRADSENRRTPLAWAAYSGNDGNVRLLLETGRVVVDSKDCEDQTPLGLAAANGHYNAVRFLMQHGADVNTTDGRDRTPLFWAATNGHEKVAIALLESKAIDVNRADNQFLQSPLTTAVENGNNGVVEFLLANDRVDVDFLDGKNRTPLSYAAWAGNRTIVGMLLAKTGVNVNNRDLEYGQSPLAWAAKNGHREVVELLAADGRVDIDSPDKAGVSPISLAAENGQEEVVKLLRERGAVMV